MLRIQRIDALVTDIEEQIFYMMCNTCKRAKLHHGGRPLDRMHDAEDLIDVIGREITDLLILYKHLIKLVQKRIRLEEVCIKHTFHTVIHYKHHLSF